MLPLTRPQKLRAIQAKYKYDPVGFNKWVLNRSPYWTRQAEIARSIVEYRVTVCYSGNAIGKDYLLGGTIPWWITTRPNSLAIVTGVSQTVLGSVTWKEVRRAIEGSPILSQLGIRLSSGVKASPQVMEVSPGWHALGYSTTTVERASGQHAPELLAVMNAASGIDDEIFDAIDSLKYQRLAVFLNPIRPDGRAVDLIHQAERDRKEGIPKHRAVNAIQIRSTESPHATWEESPWGMADRTWLEAMYRHYGVDSLWVRSHILAEIPRVSADVLIPEAWLDWAARDEFALRVRPAGHPVHATRRIACDLGEGVGRDSSCVLVRDDWGVLDVVFGSALGLPEAANLIWKKATQWGVPQEKITYDRVGIGRDFPLHLSRHFGPGQRCVGYAGSGKPCSADFANLRSESAWKLRQRLEPGVSGDPAQPHRHRVAFAIPPGTYWPRLREELKTLSYTLAGRKTRLIPKDDHCILLGHSPDISDALVQSFGFP